MAITAAALRELLARSPVLLAPMEDVSDHVLRRLCRGFGVELCYTEFVRVEGMLGKSREARRKLQLAPDDQPTAVQIYGADAELLAEAAAVAEAAGPAFLDVNCGCWIPRIAGRGAGAGWLKRPLEMVEMVRRVVQGTKLPVTVKTRLGFGNEVELPIVELAPRLEDAGAVAITVHCRTARMGYGGTADWSWAARVRERVSIPVIVNGDVRTADDAARALSETGCAAVMIGRRAIAHPWIFREALALLRRGERLPPPSAAERLSFLRTHLLANVEERGPRRGVHVTRRHLAGYVGPLEGGAELRRRLLGCETVEACLELIDASLERVAQLHEAGEAHAG